MIYHIIVYCIIVLTTFRSGAGGAASANGQQWQQDEHQNYDHYQ